MPTTARIGMLTIVPTELAHLEVQAFASKCKDIQEKLPKSSTGCGNERLERNSVSPSQVPEAARLNPFEKGEIVDFPHIYFFGARCFRW